MLRFIGRLLWSGRQRTAARHLLTLDDDRLLDIGLTRDDVRNAIGSNDPGAALCSARERNTMAAVDPSSRRRSGASRT